jgi:DNA polymerase III subunit beta
VEIPIIQDLESSTILPAIQKVCKASSRDEKRPTLMGMLLEIEEDILNMVSTDSYRLAIKKIRGGFKALENGRYIIPSAAMINLARIAGKVEKINVFRDDNVGQVRFEVGESSYIIRLIEGKFPKYDQFIPESNNNIVEVVKEDILGALKRASLISSTIRLNVGSGEITLVSESREVGEGKERIEAACEGEEISIAFNSRFLEDGIISIDGERITLGMTEPLKPGVIREKEKEDFLYIIMPIRL